LNQLLERNKTIKQQINSYCDKGERYLKTIAEKTDFSFNLNKNSTDDECENKNIIDKNESINEFKLSAKRSFVISKRRSSLNL
jgi:predicted RNA-binding protein Jag